MLSSQLRHPTALAEGRNGVLTVQARPVSGPVPLTATRTIEFFFGTPGQTCGNRIPVSVPEDAGAVVRGPSGHRAPAGPAAGTAATAGTPAPGAGRALPGASHRVGGGPDR